MLPFVVGAIAAFYIFFLGFLGDEADGGLDDVRISYTLQSALGAVHAVATSRKPRTLPEAVRSAGVHPLASAKLVPDGKAGTASAQTHWKAAIAHYQQGCDAGDPTGCRQIGIAYLEARGLPRSATAAAVWLERACVGDDAIGCRVLGAMLVDGVGLQRDQGSQRYRVRLGQTARERHGLRIEQTGQCVGLRLDQGSQRYRVRLGQAASERHGLRIEEPRQCVERRRDQGS